MFAICPYVEGDWYYQRHPHTGKDIVDETRTASDSCGSCIECGETITAGESYNHFEGWNLEDATWDTLRTCQTCVRIWDDISADSRVFGTLDMMTREACGLGLDEECDAEDDEYWEEQWGYALQADRSLPISKTMRLFGLLHEVCR